MAPKELATEESPSKKTTTEKMEIENTLHGDENSESQHKSPGPVTSIEEDKTADISQEMEQNIKDLCSLRKTIPEKCSELLKEYLEIKTSNMGNMTGALSDKDSWSCNIEEWEKTLHEFDTRLEDYKAVFEKNLLPVEFQGLVERCKSLILLQDVQKGMGLNDTQELLFSGKRDQKDCETPKRTYTKRIKRPGTEDLPSLASPVKRTSARKASSVSKIPKRKQEPMTPVTPVSNSTSLRKKLFKKGAWKT